MPQDLIALAAALSSAGTPFCTATVVRSEGSASARAGAKALVGADGRILAGHVGGGCVDALVAEAAQEALRTGRPGRVEVELSDELGATGVPCGGRLEVFVEPHTARPRVLVVGSGRIVQALSEFAARAGFDIVVDDPAGTREQYPAADGVVTDDSDYSRLPVTPDTWVVIATHHKSDHIAIQEAVRRGARGISMIASLKRRGSVRQLALEVGVPREALDAIRCPAGLDLGGSTPELIALSVVAEIVAVRNGGTCRPLREVRHDGDGGRGGGCPSH